MSEFVKSAIDRFGYLAVLLLSFLENIVPPIPSELILPLGGFLAADGQLTLIGVVVAGTVGSVLGALPLYYLGQRLGQSRIHALADRYGKWLGLSGKDIDKSQTWLTRHGYKAVFLCRMVPGVRSLISIPAGFGNMRLVPFLIYSTVGTALWTTFLVLCGWFLGENYEQIGSYIGPISSVVVVVLIVLGVGGLLLRRRKAGQIESTPATPQD